MDLSLRVGAILALMLAAAACAASNADVSKELAAADESCKTRQWKTLAGLAHCYDSVETPIWRRVAPDTLDLFEDFAARRFATASEYDSGAISREQVEQMLRSAKEDFQSRIYQRRAESERAATAAASAPRAGEETSQENDAYQDCVLRVQLASSLAFLTRSPGTAYLNAAAAGLRQCNALLKR